MRVLDLFSGIGGFSLGLERAGMQTVCFCEPVKYCRLVLAKHWPGVPIYERIESLSAARLVRDGVGAVDVICGGFPCQDISNAGLRAGLDGRSSGLWSEFARLIGECRPSWAIIENVAALRSNGLDRVLGDLAALGFDAQWHCIPASALGAPHQRDRIWIIAYPDGGGLRHESGRGAAHGSGSPESGNDGAQRFVADPLADSARNTSGRGSERERVGIRGQSVDLADALVKRLETRLESARARASIPGSAGNGGWESEPDVGRVAHGVPARMERLIALGNSLVPQIPELIGRAILAASDG